MKLLTKEVLDNFKKQGSMGDRKMEDIKIICKFFNPAGAGTWYCYEYEADTKMFYAFVTLGMGPECDEAGPVALEELESVKGPFGLGIERDMYFKSGKYTLKQIYDGLRP